MRCVLHNECFMGDCRDFALFFLLLLIYPIKNVGTTIKLFLLLGYALLTTNGKVGTGRRGSCSQLISLHGCDFSAL